VVEALPKSLVALGHEVVVLLRGIAIRKRGSGCAGLDHPDGRHAAFSRDPPRRCPARGALLFCRGPEYFDRDQLYGVSGKDYPDNAERFAEFSRAAIEFAKHVWMPDVIHCHDWQSALVPVLLRTQYEKDPTVEGWP